MELISRYFPELDEAQILKLDRYQCLIRQWNEKLNLISRREAEQFEERHLLSSLALGKLVPFPSGATVMDVGTGGGLPGIPLAIAFPSVSFFLVDSIAKKVSAVQSMIQELELPNAHCEQHRVETLQTRFDFITGRAVKALPIFVKWTTPLLKKGEIEQTPRGIAYLKGGGLEEEFASLGVRPARTLALSTLFPGCDFFDTKQALFFSSADLLPGKASGRHSHRNASAKKRGRG